MNEYRLVIDSLKECISDILASGSIDQNRLTIVLNELEKSRDMCKIMGKEYIELDELISDIKYVKYEL